MSWEKTPVTTTCKWRNRTYFWRWWRHNLEVTRWTRVEWTACALGWNSIITEQHRFSLTPFPSSHICQCVSRWTNMTLIYRCSFCSLNPPNYITVTFNLNCVPKDSKSLLQTLRAASYDCIRTELSTRRLPADVMHRELCCSEELGDSRRQFGG